MLNQISLKQIAALLLTVAVVSAGIVAAALPSAKDNAKNQSAKLEPVSGTDLKKVILDSRAAERVGIKTATVSEAPVGGTPRLVIPYSAALYDPAGKTWTYTNPRGLEFVRASIVIDRIEGNQVILVSGPLLGTKIVTVGGAELLGAEHGVGH